MHLLETRELVKEYGGRKVVREVSINVGKGEVVGLLGPNGAGKTTTFYMVTGIVRPDRGHIIFDKKDITKLPTHELIYKGISYIPQGRQIFSNLTVRENLEMGAFVTRDELTKRNIEEVFERFPFYFWRFIV